MTGRTPVDALGALRAAAADGTLHAVCRRHETLLLVAFGSTVTDPRPGRARDLDLAVHARQPLDVLGLLADLTDIAGFDAIDLLDLRRAGPVAGVEALLDGEVLVELEPDLADRLLIRATLEKMDTQWLRDWALELLAS